MNNRMTGNFTADGSDKTIGGDLVGFRPNFLVLTSSTGKVAVWNESMGDDKLVEIGSPSDLAAATVESKSLRAPMTANASKKFRFKLEKACVPVAGGAIATTKGTGTGNITLALDAGGENLLAATNFNLKTLTDGAVSALTLDTDLVLDAGTIVTATVASSNGSDTGCDDLDVFLSFAPVATVAPSGAGVTPTAQGFTLSEDAAINEAGANVSFFVQS